MTVSIPKRFFKSGFKAAPLFLVCVLYYVIMAFVAPGFFSANNSWNLLFNMMPLLILALGQTFVMIGGGIDLSVTSSIALTSVVGALVMTSGIVSNPIGITVLALLVMIGVGGAIGLVNGVAVTRFKMPPFMVTLVTMMFFSGIAIWLTASQSIHDLPEPFVNFSYNTVLGIPNPLLAGVGVTLCCWLLAQKTIYGRWMFAVGANPKAAQISGVPYQQTLVITYMISGLCGALASFLYTSRLETGSPVMGQYVLLDIIGAVVIGGTSLFGGSGKMIWTVIGTLFLVMLDNSLNLLGLSFFVIMICKGLVILIAALLNVAAARKAKTT
ncbi:MAG: ABC transporter permease [Bacteroidota bacterium]